MKRLLLLSFLTCTCLLTACSQGNTPQARINRATRALKKTNKVLTLDLLKKADKIVYNNETGSLPPEHQWSCSVTITPKKVKMLLISHYGEKTEFSDSVKISSVEYDKFLKSLAALKVRKVPEKQDAWMPGASYPFLSVSAGGKMLFKGYEDVDLSVKDGTLQDAFRKILPPKFLKVFDDPYSVMERKDLEE